MDLTRFDFQALRFMQSENVRKMSLSEIGQYVLLLCESWLGGKEATLPTDPLYLAKLVKDETVSPLVLKQFQVVQTKWGKRLQNETLKEEWDRAIQRSESGRKAVEVRWNNERNTDVSNPYIPKPSQAVPDQTNPNQEKDIGNFSNITIHYRAAMRKSHSRAKPYKEKYLSACIKYGEQTVMNVFDEWAKNNKWRADKLGSNGLRFFFIDLPELVEELRASNAIIEKEEGPKIDKVALQLENDAANESVRRELDKRLEEEAAEQEALGSLPANVF